MTMVKMLVVFVDRYETDGENGEDGDYTNGSTMIFSSHQIRNIMIILIILKMLIILIILIIPTFIKA